MKFWISIAAVFATNIAVAQTLPALNSPSRSGIVAEAAEALRTQYIFPDVGKRAAAVIHRRLSSGAYDKGASEQQFSEALTKDLAEVTHDKHLRVLALNAPPPPDLADPPKNEGGIARVDRLEGDIGYIDIVQFPRTSFAPALDEAMRTLEGTKALIIDVRRNGGGSPASVDYLVSYFTAASAPLHLNDIIWRNPSTETFRTEKFFTVPTPTKYLGRPIYVLTSKDTFSAGEECAYDLKTQKLAVLVGEVTGGGANPGKVVQLGPEFIMIMPTGRALNPVTHTNWEGRGVRPDIPALGSDALRVALGQLRAADR